MSSIPITKRGAELLKEELHRLKHVERPSVINAISEARAQGDLSENAEYDAAKEKHVPVVTKVDGGFKVTVGSVAHPMEEKHFIEWIELLADGKAYRQFLKPGEVAEAFFPVTASSVTARELCNLHGQWATQG